MLKNDDTAKHKNKVRISDENVQGSTGGGPLEVISTPLRAKRK